MTVNFGSGFICTSLKNTWNYMARGTNLARKSMKWSFWKMSKKSEEEGILKINWMYDVSFSR